MKHLTPAEMLRKVKDLTTKHHITAYDIGENTDLNTSGVHRILAGEVQNPRIKTLKIILNYIKEKISGIVPEIKKQNLTELENKEDSTFTIQQVIAQEVYKILAPDLAEFKELQHAVMKAIARQSIEAEDLKDFIESLDFKSKNDSKN